jgi:putative thioredoxin
MNDYIVDIDQNNAQQVLIEESMTRPVVVDFWSAGAEPSKTLSPLLEKLATEYQGQFVLARVNADEPQGAGIAQQLGVRSVPTVMVLKEGQPVDGFAGAQPEPQIREMLDKYLPKPWDAMLEQAREFIASGDVAAAMPLLREAWQDSGERHDITLVYVGVLIELNRLDEAETLLDGIRMADQDANYEQLRAQLALKREAAKSPEIEALEAQLAEDPDNLDLMAQLSVQFSNSGMHKEAMQTLISILQVDKEHADGHTRKTLLDIIASLGKGDPLAAEYQRKLFGLMY